MSVHQHHQRGGAEGAGYTRAPQGEDLDWQGQGSCRQYPTDMFYPVKEKQAYPAIQICKECPVWKECANWALAQREELGVWGGLTAGDRRRIWANQAPQVHTAARRAHQRKTTTTSYVYYTSPAS